MKRKWIISLGIALGCILIGIVTYTTDSVKTSAKPQDMVDVLKAEKNSEDFINLIGKDFNKNDYNKKFTEKSSVNNSKWKQNKWVLENDMLEVETNESGEPITFIDKNKMKLDDNSKKQNLLKIQNNKNDIDNYLKSATDIADSLQKDDKIFIGKETTNEGFIAFTWKRTINKIIFSNDFIQIIVDPADGKVASVSKRWTTIIPDNLDTKYIDESNAKDIATKYLQDNNVVIKSFLSSNLEIVLPNNDVLSSKVVYSIKFNTDKSTGQFVWVDATTGNVVGGDQELSISN